MASGCPDGGEKADGWGDGEVAEQLLGEAGVQAHLQTAPRGLPSALGLCGEAKAGRCQHELPVSVFSYPHQLQKEGVDPLVSGIFHGHICQSILRLLSPVLCKCPLPPFFTALLSCGIYQFPQCENSAPSNLKLLVCLLILELRKHGHSQPWQAGML